MPETLLRTKLFVPPLRPNLVPRHHLIDRLNQGLRQGHKLTLVSAPAGFGKTTLLSEWIAKSERPAAWISLDDGDNDLSRFLIYLVAALQTLALNADKGQTADLGKGVLEMIQSAQPPPTDLVLTAMLNEIAVVPGDFILILDDYHAIGAKAIDAALSFLIEHLPPQMHLVMATREDPNLPLSRLRAGGLLTELRVTDLRFGLVEASNFLNQAMGLGLSAEELASLETRTEGWIAGLQLAALSIRGRDDVAGFIKTFAGDNRYIVDYLIEEVLKRQPERIRNFLLKTSIFERLNGPLCDAVTGQDGGKATLEALERGNLFVVPLDDKRQWYRYHHLFADVLQALMKEEQPDQLPVLHQRASEWYEQNGQLADAIRHALAAKDFERSANLVELTWPEMDWSFQSDTWLGWVSALPDALVRARPVLSAGYAWSLLSRGELEAAEARLRDVERWLDTPAELDPRLEAPSPEMIVVDEEQFRTLPATVASARAYHAQALGDVSGSVKFARQALALLPGSDHLARGRLAVLLGLAYWARGDLEEAYQSFAGAMDSFQTAGNILFAISFAFIMADIRTAQGRLSEAIGVYERSIQVAGGHGDAALEGIGDLHLGLSELFYEQGDVEVARQHLQRSEELDEPSEVYRYRLCRARARIRKSQDDLNGALELLEEAERLFTFKNPIPDVRPTAAQKTRIWLLQGRLTEAFGWVSDRGLSVDDDLTYLSEFEHVTLAKVLIARYRSDSLEGTVNDAMGLLERLLTAAEDGGRKGSAIEILVTQVIAYHAIHDTSSALASLKRAMALAEPEGYIQIFVDEGASMKQLLLEAAARGIMPDYTKRLLAGFGAREQRSKSSLATPLALQQLSEPLSQRELAVLRLLKTELSGPEIASELMIALSTVRSHTKSIYSKLNVNNRQAAVIRAVELGLI